MDDCMIAVIFNAMLNFIPAGDTFYSARNARIASALLATAIPSVCPSVRLSVRYTPVLCQNDGTQHGAVCTIG